MKTEKEIRSEIERLNKEHENRMPKPKTCSCCGQPEPFMSSFSIFDSSIYNGKISALYWVLGQNRPLQGKVNDDG